MTLTSRSQRLHDRLELLAIVLLILAALLGYFECVPPYSDFPPPTYVTSTLTTVVTRNASAESCTSPPCSFNRTLVENITVTEKIQTRVCRRSIGIAHEAAVEFEKWLHYAVLSIFLLIGLMRFFGWIRKRYDQARRTSAMDDHSEWLPARLPVTIRRAVGGLEPRIRKLGRPALMATIGTLWLIALFAVGYLEPVVAIAIILCASVITIGYFFRKHDRPVSLWNIKPIFDINAFENATVDLSAIYDKYRNRLSLSRITFDVANSGRMESESKIYAAALLLFAFGVFYYFRINPYHPEQGTDFVALFLLWYGIFVLVIPIAVYLLFLRRFSDRYARFRLQGSNASVHRRTVYAAEFIASRERLSRETGQGGELLKASTQAELTRIAGGLAALSKSLLEPGFRLRIAAVVTLLGTILGMLGLNAQYIATLGQQTQAYLILAGMYFVVAVVLLIALPVKRARNLLEWNDVDASVRELDQCANRLMNACLGEEVKSVLRRDLVFWNPSPRDRRNKHHRHPTRESPPEADTRN